VFYGWGLFGHNALAEWVYSNLKNGNRINMFADAVFSPIYAEDLAELLLDIHHKDFRGVYNVAGRELCSKYDFGIGIARAFGFDTGNISRGSISDVQFKAPRPKNLSLDVSKLERALNRSLPDLKSGIERFRNCVMNRTGKGEEK
jgi:dTDP-4-dehydrorhamnose reductase